MTNTYLLAGEEDPESIIASTPKGVYVKHLGGGQVNTATGDFVFGMTEAYLIEDGKVTEPAGHSALASRLDRIAGTTAGGWQPNPRTESTPAAESAAGQVNARTQAQGD